MLFDREAALGTLVRFKGMVQDMFNTEFYSKTYSVFNTVTDETKIYQGKYSSSIVNEVRIIHFQEKLLHLILLFTFLQPFKEVKPDDKLMERHVISCIPIPGLNKWVDDGTCSNNEIEAELYVFLI